MSFVDANSSRHHLVDKPDLVQKVFVVQASKRNLMFKDKECTILILKNLTTLFQFERAFNFGQSMKMLTATVSHEMRLPLQGIISMCLILLKDLNDAHNVELTNSIMSAGKILLSRVNDLLDTSVIEKGTFKPILKAFNVIKVVKEVIAINNQQALYKDVKLGLIMKTRVPKFIRTDCTRMQ